MRSRQMILFERWRATLTGRLIPLSVMTAAPAIAPSPACPVALDPTIEPTSPLNYPVSSDAYSVQYTVNGIRRSHPLAVVVLLLAALAPINFAATCVPVLSPGEIDPTPSTTVAYPMISDRYSVQYRINGGAFQDATTYISYYGATSASPFLNFSKYKLAYQATSSPTSLVTPVYETSMSFVSIKVPAADYGLPVDILVTNKQFGPFAPGDKVAVRPASKAIGVTTKDPKYPGKALISTTWLLQGQQFILWWERDPVGGRVEGLAVFLNPEYPQPKGPHVLTVTLPSQVDPIPAGIDTLDFEGPLRVPIATTGKDALIIPSQVKNVYLGEGAWVQGKLRFQESGSGDMRHIYGPGVLDGSLFQFNGRNCAEDAEGYSALSIEPLVPGTPGIHDQYLIEGIVISDTNRFATDPLDNTTVRNVKTLGWNLNNDGLLIRNMSSADTVFVRSGDDSLKLWGSYSDVTNATVWQNYNGAVVSLGWFNNSPGENSLIDGLYVVNTDWATPTADTLADFGWNASPSSIENLNNGVIASEMVPGTQFGLLQPSLYRNIFVDATPQVLFSLKIVPPRQGTFCSQTSGVDLQTNSVLNLNIEGFHTPESMVENRIGFQVLPAATPATPAFTFCDQMPPLFPSMLPYTLPGSMSIGLYDVEVTPKGGPTAVLPGKAGKVVTNGTGVSVTYGSTLPAPGGAQWYSAWGAPHGIRIVPAKPLFPANNMNNKSVRMIVRPTISGTAVRVKIENTQGNSDVSFLAVYIGAVLPGTPPTLSSNTRLTFNGSQTLKLAPRAGAWSDPLPFSVTASALYAISLDVDKAVDISSHLLGLVTNYMTLNPGQHASDPTFSSFHPVPDEEPNPDTTKKGGVYPFYWVAALDVLSTSATGAIVALGDSITDGACSTRTAGSSPTGTPGDITGTVLTDVYQRWTDQLAVRLAGTKAVVREGIAGNFVGAGGSSDGVGQPALVRIANDVLGREGATHVILFEGTNDLAAKTGADKLISDFQRIIGDAHLIGLNIIGATIIPRGGDTNGWDMGMETERQKLNDWMRHGADSITPFDGLIDFDAMLQGGPLNMKTKIVEIPAAWSCYDGVHLNSDGYVHIASLINLTLFDTPLRSR